MRFPGPAIAMPSELWCIAHIDQRRLFYGPNNQVIRPVTAALANNPELLAVLRVSIKSPVAEGATREQALGGGEDYELLYTGRNLPGIRIGTVTDDPSGSISLDGHPLNPEGWDHFRESE